MRSPVYKFKNTINTSKSFVPFCSFNPNFGNTQTSDIHTNFKICILSDDTSASLASSAIVSSNTEFIVKGDDQPIILSHLYDKVSSGTGNGSKDVTFDITIGSYGTQGGYIFNTDLQTPIPGLYVQIVSVDETPFSKLELENALIPVELT